MGDILVGVVIGARIAIVTTALTSLTDLFKGIWSARRQTASWRRQTMFQVTHDYIESAFALSGISSNVRAASKARQPKASRLCWMSAGLTTR